jgi:hypothetical protein
MSEQLPERIEKIIREHEERLTAELRKLTGRDDLVAHFDRTPLLPQEPNPLPEDYWETAQ